MNNATTLHIGDSVEHALELLDQALSILDGEDLLIAAAKVDEARNSLRKAANND